MGGLFGAGGVIGQSHLLATVTIPDAATFAVAAVIVLGGAFGVVFTRNPVHAALMLVMTLFGIAVLFVEENAQFLAAVQVIVYTGAIVVLFLFVIMLLGVDKADKVFAETFRGQRVLASLLGVCVLAEVTLLARGGHWSTGAHSVTGALSSRTSNITQLGQSLFTRYLVPFEATSALLIVAIVGAVVLARRPNEQEAEGDGASDQQVELSSDEASSEDRDVAPGGHAVQLEEGATK